MLTVTGRGPYQSHPCLLPFLGISLHPSLLITRRGRTPPSHKTKSRHPQWSRRPVQFLWDQQKLKAVKSQVHEILPRSSQTQGWFHQSRKDAKMILPSIVGWNWNFTSAVLLPLCSTYKHHKVTALLMKIFDTQCSHLATGQTSWHWVDFCGFV